MKIVFPSEVNKMVDLNTPIVPSDMQIAQKLLNDLKNALGGK